MSILLHPERRVKKLALQRQECLCTSLMVCDTSLYLALVVPKNGGEVGADGGHTPRPHPMHMPWLQGSGSAWGLWGPIRRRSLFPLTLGWTTWVSLLLLSTASSPFWKLLSLAHRPPASRPPTGVSTPASEGLKDCSCNRASG